MINYKDNGKIFELTVSKKEYGRDVIIYLVFIVVYYIIVVASFKGDLYLRIVVYSIPILFLPKMKTLLQGLILGRKMVLNKSNNQITVNGKKKGLLSEVDSVQIEYNTRAEINECKLYLSLKTGGKIFIKESDAFHNKKILVMADNIAKFTEAKVVQKGTNLSI